MLDLVKVNLPDAIEVEGRFFLIDTDFRKWINFESIINDKSAIIEDLDLIYYLGDVPENRQKGLEQLISFYSPKSELPRIIEDGEPIEKTLDYHLDADLIYAAFYEVYHIDLFQTDATGHAIPMHWWKFLALLSGIHGTKLNEIMGFRSYNPNDKTTYEQHMRQLKEQWQLPQKIDAKSQEALDNFNKYFD